MTDAPHLAANIDRFSGFADLYDDYRPKPPAIMVDLLAQLAQTEHPSLVVDIGSGTGLSTRLWAERAVSVIGIEPNDDMRHEAQRRTGSAMISYRAGTSKQTGLADQCADIVTAVQALHWMEPEPTFAEVARILRGGGVFAAVDCDWPPVMHWEAEAAYEACMKQVGAVTRKHGLAPDVKKWSKHEHLSRMSASGQFRHVREVVLHTVETGTADRLVGLALSQGAVATLLKHGISEDEAGITALRNTAQRTLDGNPWYFSYRIRLGVK
jgi:ubiquinone/menaquinone biosynthesis C-methylase UbiE